MECLNRDRDGRVLLKLNVSQRKFTVFGGGAYESAHRRIES